MMLVIEVDMTLHHGETLSCTAYVEVTILMEVTTVVVTILAILCDQTIQFMVPGVAGLLVASHVEEDNRPELALIHHQQMEEEIARENLPEIAIQPPAIYHATVYHLLLANWSVQMERWGMRLTVGMAVLIKEVFEFDVQRVTILAMNFVIMAKNLNAELPVRTKVVKGNAN